MAMNEKLYITNPKNSVISIIVGAATPVTVVNNSVGVEPLKVIGLKVNVGSSQDIAVDLGSGTSFTLALSTGVTVNTVIDLLPLMPYSLDHNGNKFFIVPPGVTFRVDVNSTSNILIVTYESYTA